MIRKIIEIDEERVTGVVCVPLAEGAIQIIDGKAN